MMTALKPVLDRTTYDRSHCQTGVVHLGFGAFHRAHQAVYLDDLMECSGDLRWGIAAVNLRAAESAGFAAQRDHFEGYILKSAPPEGDPSYRLVRSHVEFADWSSDRDAAESLLARASVHLVTITVTESGYYTDDAGALNPDDPIIAGELAGGAGQSVYAYLAAGLRRRMNAAGQPLTISCCDNIRRNGKMLQSNLMAYLALSGQQDLAEWVRANATFPCSMVDRITPRSTENLRNETEDMFGQTNAMPIMAESFVQWVIEDNFAGPMPDLTLVGVTVTPDVDPYEEAKIRILNGGHTGLTYLAALRDIKTFDQAMAVPELRAHFDAYEQEEVLPALTLKLPFDKGAYLASIASRFSNSAIADSVERICADGMAKFPIFIRPTLQGCLEQGRMPVHGLKAVASWYVFARHVSAGKMNITYVEPSWALLEPMLSAEGLDRFVTSELLWADLPQRFPNFCADLRAEIIEMEKSWPV